MATHRTVRNEKLVAAGLLFLLVGLALGLSLGSVSLPLRYVIKALAKGPSGAGALSADGMETLADAIVWTLRFPRVLLAFIEGAGLAVAGSVMQGLFRNPMADPYVLGVSSGASLGAVLGIALGLGGVFGVWSLPALAFLGALGTAALVYALSTYRKRTDTWTLLLAGIAVSSLISSLIAFIMVIARERVDEIVFWTMGALSRASWMSVGVSLVYTVPGLFVLLRHAKALNALSFGEEPAFHMGVRVEPVKRTLLWTSSLVVAGGVAFTGPIGFIGLIVPHAVRLVAGPDHRWLMPLSGLFGGNALLFADLIARVIAPPREMPVGVITALSGAPFFLYLLAHSRRRRE
ncbi:MAG: iron ABC transporter permease [Firmicutes bacterium]|nr:iron ABC transporter permease [Candidatus Fermentithermobacillaceae bacterium]